MAAERKKTITKRDVVKRTAKIVGEKQYLTEKVVDGTFQALRELMLEANPEIRIEIRDFGVLEVKKAKAKPKARNPKTGEIVSVPAHRKTHFKAGKLLKEFLKWSVGKKFSGRDKLTIIEQSLPGQEEFDEKEAVKRGLPDACIYDDNGWILIIESKSSTIICRPYLTP